MLAVRRVLVRVFLFACVALAGACAASAQQSASPNAAPDWMSGYWLSCADGAQTVENWFGAGTGVLLGTNLTRGQQNSFEFLRVAPNTHGGLSYYAMPSGRAPPTEFVMISNDGRRVVFANEAHDFPQRVIYARAGDVLTARIEGTMNGAPAQMEWTFQRAAPDTRCPG
jgi:hypothetical protein